MNEHHLTEMAEAAANRVMPRFSDDPDWDKLRVQLSSEIKQGLLRCWEDKIALTWSINDVRTAVAERGRKITKEQARGVLNLTQENHEASLGVNWDTLRMWADAILDEEGEPDAWEEGWEPDEE